MNNVDNHSLDKPSPGCLGRMVNLFDLSLGTPRNKLLSDKPYHDGSQRRSQSDVPRLGQFGDQIEDKASLQIDPKYGINSSARKSNGTPMKMLIAREMSKELESKHNPPSVVAKLMGLDTLPQQEPELATYKSHSRGYSRTISDPNVNYRLQDKGFRDSHKQNELRNYAHPDEYKDVYEIMQQPQKPNHIRDTSPQKVTYDALQIDRKVAFVRQKFIEAKRLSANEKLRQSPKFDDALEVLNSNKDLFLKFLQEPNPIFSQRLQRLQSVHSQHDTKRITLLKPCKMVDNAISAVLATKHEKQIRKGTLVDRAGEPDKDYSGHSSAAADWELEGNSSQQTRIVVLKPSLGNNQDVKAVASPTFMSTRLVHNDELAEESDDVETQKSRKVAKEITQQRCANLSSHRRDDFLLSSVFSNDYFGDESSFHKSETTYAADRLSDSEVMSPASRQSWDYVSRFGSPYTVSSCSRASYSPESSVGREAKKRLSERWAMMTSTGNHREQRPVGRSSSTLGEMLALSEANKAASLMEWGHQDDPKHSMPSCTNDLYKNEDVDKSTGNLVRSKSASVSSTVFGTGINTDSPNQEANKTDALKEEASKGKSGKLSLRGKVSSLFISRNRKVSKGKTVVPQSEDESQTLETQCTSPERGSNHRTECDSISLDEKVGMVSNEAGFNLRKRSTYGDATENQDQPSPISVLETPFEEDEHTANESSGNNNPEHGRLLGYSKCNLIDKSPPIGSIARNLSWDDSCVDTATSYPMQSSFSPHRAEEEEREWFSFVQTLLSVAGLEGEMQSDVLLSRWHSSDSPLDPSLRDKYVYLNIKETMHESKRRQRRSTRKLVFDCVNAALLDIAGYGPDTCQRVIPCSGPHKTLMSGGSVIMVDRVWARMKEWFSGEERCVAVDCWDSNSLVVERVVRKEVAGNGWGEHLRLEMDNVEVEIGRRLLEELLRETVVEFVGRAL